MSPVREMSASKRERIQDECWNHPAGCCNRCRNVGEQAELVDDKDLCKKPCFVHEHYDEPICDGFCARESNHEGDCECVMCGFSWLSNNNFENSTLAMLKEICECETLDFMRESATGGSKWSDAEKIANETSDCKSCEPENECECKDLCPDEEASSSENPAATDAAELDDATDPVAHPEEEASLSEDSATADTEELGGATDPMGDLNLDSEEFSSLRGLALR